MFRLTETQTGMFLEWNANRASLQYNITGSCRLPASVDLIRLESAVRETVAAHPVFRTRVIEADGVLQQEFNSAAEIPYEQLTFSTETEAEAFCKGFSHPFDLLGGELVRFAFLETPTAKFFAFDISHFVFDGSTWALFFGEIAARYDGQPVEAEGASYADFAAAEEMSFSSADYAAAAADHRARFADVTMAVPDDSVPTPSSTSQPGALLTAVASVDKIATDAGCQALGVSPNLFFMGVFARVLAVFAKERKFAFLTVNHGRRDPAFRRTLGACIKTVPVLAELKGDLSLGDWLKGFKLHRAGVYPFTHAARDLGLSPGFMFVFQDGTTDISMEVAGERYPIEVHSPVGASELPSLQVYADSQDGLPSYRFELSCLSGRYSQTFLDDFVALVASVARNFATCGDCRLGEIPLLSEADQTELLRLSQGETLAYDASQTFVDLVAEHVRAIPDRTALVDCETSLTYAELARRADALAARLVELGVSIGGFVGLMLPRRVSFPISLLAVQKCGAGYVPIDPEYPADRIAYMLADSGAPVLVTTHALFDGKNLDFSGQVVFFEEEVKVEGQGQQRTDRPLSTSTSNLNLSNPSSPAYMIYTSGSTGRPKGVVVPQRAVVNLCRWTSRDLGISCDSRIATHPSFSFDASVIDLFPALAGGAGLHLFSEEVRKDLSAMRDYIVAHRITGGTMSTQIGRTLVDAYPDLPLDYVVLGGEKLLPTAKTDIRIVNGYGPTEFCVCSSAQEVDQSCSGEIPIGRPVPNTWSFVCDPLGQLVPRGLTGELCLAGVQMADGYWHNPEKTAQAFVPVPFELDLDLRPRPSLMYRTGDYACYNADGLLEYRGRIDFQVKLRGFRIEIGEIEHAAAACAGVDSAIALVREIVGAQHLVLYYTGSAEKEVVRTQMTKTLTGYMVPDYFVALEKMPMTPVGKIDRKALPLPDLSDEPVVAPAGAREAALLDLVKEVLKADGFGVTHDFNRLGLTSLGAMTLVARLRAKLGLSVTMRQLVERPTVRALAELGEAAGGVAAQPAPTRRPKRASYPMTENQRGVYADWLRASEATQYNMPLALRFPGVDAARLAAAVTRVLDAHPAFKTRFAEKNGELVQLRRDEAEIPVAVETVQEEPDTAFFASRMRPFAPQGEDLVRASVFASPQAASLFLDVHHTVFDGVSVGVFLTDLLRTLDGAGPKGERTTAFEAALNERDYLESEQLAEDDAWFSDYLDGSESTRLDLTAPDGAEPSGEVGRVSMRFPAAEVVRRCGELGVSASDWFLTSFMELMRRIGRSDDVQIAFVSAGRADPDFADTTGMFVKTLPVRNVKDARTFSETVTRTRNAVRDLIDRDRYSFVRASEKFGLHPEIIFAFEGGLFDLPTGVEILSPQLGKAKCPLSVLVTPGKDDFELAFEYEAARYSERDMRAVLDMFGTLARNAVLTDELRAIPLVSQEAAQALLSLSAGAPVEYDADKTFVSLFRAQALVRPFATAVVDCEASMTYGELETRSNALAASFVRIGVPVGGFVGLMLPRRLSFVVSILGVQKCGAGYVPIDAEYPADRIAYMLADSGAAVLVTTRALYAGKNLDFAGKVVFFEEEVSTSTSNLNLSNPSSPAYMIYTSGSTGKPKGVVVPHRALRHLCAWLPTALGITYDSRIGTHPSFSFDASVIDLFPTLAVGAELHIYAEEIRKDLPALRDYIVSHGLTGSTMSTQIGRTFIDAYPDLPLSYLQLGGEKLLPTAKTAVRIVNGYGPTEFCVCSSYQIVDQSRSGEIPIGRPVPGTSTFIVDRYGHLLPRGFVGEMALAGPQLADGYWHNSEKTKAVFVEVPFELGLGRRSRSTAEGDSGSAVQGMSPLQKTGSSIVDLDLRPRPSLMYRTGDLARYNDAGELEYLGRIDFQVKLRGFRIEIGEIEHAAAAFPGVGAVAAEVREVGGTKHLVLYYAADGSVDEAAMKAQMAGSLAAYMVPDFFVRMDALPMTPNGKIDRRRLVSPVAGVEAEYVEPRKGAEADIAAAYAETLKLDRFSATADFFLSGGTSLLGIKAVVVLQKRGLDVQYGDLFKYKTPRALAAFLTGDPQLSTLSTTSTLSTFDYGAYDYAAVDALLAATRQDLFDGFKVHSLGDVLLTGATGYLGIHVLRFLLERTSFSVAVLIRPKRGAGPERRLDAAYVYYFGERLPRSLRDRISFVEGDITDTDLTGRLADVSVNTVVNCAALVKHYVSDDAMDRINVGGVENLIRFCEATKARLVQTSTYSVGGTVGASSPAVLSERTLFVGQESDNDYIRTKFLAERAVLAAVAAGRIRGKVMRLGNLMGRESDGEFQMNVGANAFVNSLKSYKAIGAFPLEDLSSGIEMSPIDRVAEAVCLLATTPDDMVVFHPFNAYALDLGAVLGAMNRRGYAVDWVSRDEFAVRVEALRNDPTRADELQGILHYAQRHLEGRKATPVVNAWTTTVLYRLGFRWKPAEDGYLARFFEMLDGLAALD